jgi:hypothetical protein
MTQQINLYDPSLLRQRDWLALGNVVAAALLLAVAVGLLGAWARQDLPALTAQAAANDAQLKTLRDQIATLGQQVANRKADPRVEQELGATRLLLAARAEVLAVLKQRLGPDADSFADYLRGFARQSVAGLWLTGFSFDAVSGGMEIQGRTVDPALLPEYIRRLNKEQAFQGRAFAALKLAEGQIAARPETAAAPAVAPAPAARSAAASRAPFHEFILTPAKSGGAVPVLTRALGPGSGGQG